MTKPMNRRIFLRGLGGACVAAPFLSTIGDRSARAQAATPKRLIMMFTHYGCITTKFFPKLSHGALTAADLEGTPTLKSLAPFANKLLIPRGIRGMNEWTQNLKRGQGNDPHTQVAGSYFTCQPVTPNSDDPFSFSMATKFQAKPIGPSLDHVIAQQLASSGVPMLINVGNGSDSPQSAISYSAAQTAYKGLGTPQQVYMNLTGLFGNMAAPTPDDYAAVRGKSVLDLVKDDLETLERFDMSMADREKLEAWKQLLVETGGPVATAQCSEETAEAIGATSANATAVKTGVGTDVLTQKIGDTLEGADIYSNMAALAAVCNANPVILLKYPGSYLFRNWGFDIEAHSLSHRLDNAGMSGPCVADVVNKLLQIDAWYASKFAHLVDMLNKVPEGESGQTVLDQSAAVWFNEMSDGNAHNLNNLPIIQAGSMGGYFKQGWSVNVDGGTTDLSAGNSESQCVNGGQSNGLNQGTGTDPKFSNAPINKYFCNLMNSMGIKADANGFPAKDGPASEVTHYGRYDKTEDFIGGDKNPAKINNPGEYAELRA